MTDTELDALEALARAVTPGQKRDIEAYSAFIAATNPAAILELLAELRQAKKERDWLVDMTTKACNHQNGCPFIFWDCKIEGDSCSNICLINWLEAAKEATSCKKN